MSGAVDLPDPVEIAPEGDAFVALELARPVRLSNPDKPFFTADGYTKGDLVQYYASIASTLLPHLSGRALSMSRYPDGADGPSFYEKQCPSHAPEWLVRAPIHSSHRGEPIEFCTTPDRESLMWVANLGCIEMHPWLSRVVHPDMPDFAVFDLDPQEGATWEQVRYVAGLVNVVLERLGLAGYPKTSGASGMHIYVPLEPRHDYRRVREFVAAVGRMIAAADPDAATMEWDIPKRGPRVFIDHNQNVGGKTIASVYSVRPEPGAPVSTPLRWDEVDEVVPGDFTIASIWNRLREHGDLFAPALAGGQVLDGAEAALGLPQR
jgi:bifunctional non-homologous end joining protein LigD